MEIWTLCAGEMSLRAWRSLSRSRSALTVSRLSCGRRGGRRPDDRELDDRQDRRAGDGRQRAGGDLRLRGTPGDPAADVVGDDQLGVQVRQRHEAARGRRTRGGRGRPWAPRSCVPTGGPVGSTTRPSGKPGCVTSTCDVLLYVAAPRGTQPVRRDLVRRRDGEHHAEQHARGGDHAVAPEDGDMPGEVHEREPRAVPGARHLAQGPGACVYQCPVVRSPACHAYCRSSALLPAHRWRRRPPDGRAPCGICRASGYERPRHGRGTAARPLGRARSRPARATPGVGRDPSAGECRAARADRHSLARLSRLRPGPDRWVRWWIDEAVELGRRWARGADVVLTSCAPLRDRRWSALDCPGARRARGWPTSRTLGTRRDAPVPDGPPSRASSAPDATRICRSRRPW